MMIDHTTDLVEHGLGAGVVVGVGVGACFE